MKVRNISPLGGLLVDGFGEWPAGAVRTVTDEQAQALLSQPVNFEAVTAATTTTTDKE